MTAKRQFLVVQLVTQLRGCFESKIECEIYRRNGKRTVVFQGFLRPEHVFVALFSEVLAINMSLHIVEGSDVFDIVPG